MKTKLLLAAAALIGVNVIHAQNFVSVGFTFGSPPACPPPVYVAPAPVVVAAPVYAPPPVVYCAPIVAPAPVFVAPPRPVVMVRPVPPPRFVHPGPPPGRPYGWRGSVRVGFHWH